MINVSMLTCSRLLCGTEVFCVAVSRVRFPESSKYRALLQKPFWFDEGNRGEYNVPLNYPTKERWKPPAPSFELLCSDLHLQDSGCHQRERQKSRHPAENNKLFSNWKKRYKYFRFNSLVLWLLTSFVFLLL